jgi:hypothetical protein
MFNLKVKFMLAAAVLFIGGVSAANAQLVTGGVIKAKIPNAFVLRDETFPAGTYTIERTPSIVDSPSLMVLRGEKTAVIFDTMFKESATVAENTALVFDNVDGVDYLSKIVIAGDTVAIEVPQTKSERNIIAKGGNVQHIILSDTTGF